MLTHDYGLVFELKQAFPELHLSINGGISSLTEAKRLLNAGLDGVMIGRAAYQRPYDILAGIDQEIFFEDSRVCAKEVVRRMMPYIERHIKEGGKLNHITRHMLGLFAGQGGARKWRRFAGGRGAGSRGNAHSADGSADGGRWSRDGGRLPDGRQRQRRRGSRRRHEELADVGAFQQGDRGPEGVDSDDHLG